MRVRQNHLFKQDAMGLAVDTKAAEHKAVFIVE
ncbi:hypothetical protein L1279_000551 [Planomicrobium sp. HSC-17F08]|nr:hypothetical protein [Planomicrobium sp. HSC-17F08]